jgi:hypothetical protein
MQLLPGQQGNEGEQEIEDFLGRTVGTFMNVRNVSKIGQGHEMDLLLTSRDGFCTIRIDVKNHKSANLLPDKEVDRFYSDIDAIKPAATAAILFIRPALRCQPDQSNMGVIRSRRSNTDVFQIGEWAVGLLMETILHIIAEHLHSRTQPAQQTTFPGATQVKGAVNSLCQLVAFNNEHLSNTSKLVSDWTKIAAERTRQTAESLRAAHSANPVAVTTDVVADFEKQLPKRSRGKAPAAVKPPPEPHSMQTLLTALQQDSKKRKLPDKADAPTKKRKTSK